MENQQTNSSQNPTCDIIVPLGVGSRWMDNELRYALRSIEKHLSGYRDIYIIGAPRKWLQNVKYIDAPEQYTRKEKCIFDKLIRAAEHPDVSSTFITTNDDIFFLKPIAAAEIKYWKSGNVKNLLVKTQGLYRSTVANTEKYLRENNLPDGHFDIHVPILYEKEKMMMLLKIDWSRDHIIKSLYCNTNYIKGEEMRDLKFSRPFRREEIRKAIEGRMFFSISEYGTNDSMKDILQELFPEPSRYEKTN